MHNQKITEIDGFWAQISVELQAEPWLAPFN